jgi:hypothetical protein
MPRDTLVNITLLKRLRSANIWGSGLALLLAAVLLNEIHPVIAPTAHLPPPTIIDHALNLLDEFLKDLGFAFVIGWVISFAIEQASKEELKNIIEGRINEFSETIQARLKDIQHHVFHSTYRRHIPLHFIDEIEKLVFDSEFIRRNNIWNYVLSVMRAPDLDPSDPTLPDMPVVYAEVTMSYEVENITNDPLPFEVCVNLEKPPFKALERFVKVEEIRINGKKLTPAELAEGLGADGGSSGATQFKKTIDVIPPKHSVRILGRCKTIKLQDDVELWRSLVMSEGMTLMVRFPKEAKAKGAAAIHRIRIQEKTETEDACVWSIEGPVLPQQGFVFWWRCSEEPGPREKLTAQSPSVSS